MNPLFLILYLFVSIIAIIIFGVNYIYKNFYRLNVETDFVKINDQNCNCSRNSRGSCDSKYCVNKMMQKIISKIEGAKESIDIAMYNFTNSYLAQAIIRARNRHIPIRIIVDKLTCENEDNYQTQATTLLRNGKLYIF